MASTLITSFFVQLFFICNFVSSQKYLGCYKDNGSLLYHEKSISNLTPQQCIDYCQGIAYTYAGVKYGSRCFCGDDVPDNSLKVQEESNCNYKCSGDKEQICGGYLRFSIYKILNPREVSSQDYLGCFKDNGSVLYHEKVISNLTPQQCIDYCQETGYSFAGVKYGSRCFCGDDVPNNSLKVEEESNCNYKCSGDKSKICGGFLRFAITKILNPRKAYDYLGCYKDQLPRSLSGLYENIDKMTPFQCIDLCKAKGYAFAGLQSSAQCYCGNQIPPEKLAESDCNYKCSGDSSKICGGTWRNSVYFTGLCNAQCENGGTCISPKNTCICPELFNGAYCQNKLCVDSPTTPLYSTKSCTSEKCTITCSDKYQFPDGSTTVNVSCSGGSWLPASIPNCQGKSLFPVTVSTQEYLGCYIDNGRVLYHEKSITLLTPQRCIDYCQETGYSYAGVKYGSRCFCGDDDPDSSLKVQESNNCNYKCSGDKAQICGGFLRFAITKILNPRKAYDYLGCYKDQLPRSLSELYENIDKMTPFQCIDLCKAKGYAFAGLQSSAQCFCGNQIPPVKLAESDCNYKCSGDSSKICGGTWRNSVYFTGVCTTQCQNGGTCISPNTCICPANFNGAYCQNKLCVDSPTTPLYSTKSCTSEKCTITCSDKYQFPDGSRTVNLSCSGGSWLPASIPNCQAICSPQCQNGGTCISPNVCSCPENFYGLYCQNKQCVGYPPTPNNSIKSCNSATCTITCSDKYQFPDGSTTVNLSCSGGSWLPASIPNCQAICSPQCQNGGTCISPNVCRCPENFYGLYCQNKQCVGYPPTPTNSIKSCNSATCTITCSDKYQFPDGSTTVYVSCSGGSWLPSNIPDCQAICKPQCQNGGTCISPNVCSCPENFYGFYCQNKRCVGYPSTPINSIKSCNSETCTITCSDKYQFPDGSTTVNVSCSGGSWLPASIPDCEAKLQQYLGCYSDTHTNRTLKHYKQFYNALTPQACLSYCASNGYSYFGLQYRSECYCGNINESDIVKLKVSESECNLNCTGDNNQICGASARNSLYKILKL